jgi:hypothetical protein
MGTLSDAFFGCRDLDVFVGGVCGGGVESGSRCDAVEGGYC